MATRRKRRETREQEALRLHTEQLTNPNPENEKRLGDLLDALAAQAEIPSLEAAVKAAQARLDDAHKRVAAAN